MGHVNLVAITAKKLARTPTRLVLVEQNTISAHPNDLFRARFVAPLARWLYPHADAVVGVSKGVARDLELLLGFAPGKVKVINNPVVNNELFSRATNSVEHPWLQDKILPVFLAVGRLTPQKDFPNLLQAFAFLKEQRLARLIILGEGESRAELEAKICSLGISEAVSMPGFVNNPYAYMSRASALVLSSQEEGLPTVLIEAMACGCPVVATNCPSGPEEILAGGKYGNLVPVKNSRALSQAMLQVLDDPIHKEVLIARAKYFSAEQVVEQYLNLLCSL
jgi:glycosyltransferase involved in cell wall biosynthesis